MTIQRQKPRMGAFDRAYWEYVQRGKLRLQRCEACSHVRYPPAAVCPDCLAEETEWTAISGIGRLVTWTVFRRQYLPEFPVPFTVASVALAEGPLVIGELLGSTGEDLRPGLPVRAVFQELQSGEGPWRICQWQLA